jgi:predicted RNA-binding Zn ribbon-like protein
MKISDRKFGLSTAANFLPIDQIPLVGGRLCLDFVNTTGARRSSAPRERLIAYHDVITWFWRSGLISRGSIPALRRRVATHPTEAFKALNRCRTLREALYRMFLAALDEKSPADRDLELLNRTLAAGATSRRLVYTGSGIRRTWVPNPKRLDWMLYPAAESAAELLTSPDLERLKKCGECDWLFVDTTKNESRLWCKKACGDRVKSRRYYERHNKLRRRRRTRGREVPKE